MKRVAIVGKPNVGKSVLFGCLTGVYQDVSNYPGTTVDVCRGRGVIEGDCYEIVDTPGMYSVHPITEEERVARRILLDERPEVVLHVVDAKNLESMLIFTLQLIEADLPVVLVLNMMDEARIAGLSIDRNRLAGYLGVPVVCTVGIAEEGIGHLKDVIHSYTEKGGGKIFRESVDSPLEKSVADIEALLDDSHVLSRRAVALLLLQRDSDLLMKVSKRDHEAAERIEQIVVDTEEKYGHPLDYVITMAMQEQVRNMVKKVVSVTPGSSSRLSEKLSRLTTRPVTGVPILLLVLYLGLYKFVGGFGAGVVVDFIEGTIFEGYINPFVIESSRYAFPWPSLTDLVAGEYGIITLGVRYAVAIILPIVGLFFLVFSIIEDSGYLPRLAMLVDSVFKKIGLSGRAVIPMVLGFGCVTMATIVTRTLPTKRERVIATVLLSLAVPCSAQIGVIMGLLGARGPLVLVWACVIAGVFLLTGILSAKVVPGVKPSFYMELPPLRLPVLSNVLVKTFTRMKWYFREILPLFILASVIIWAGRLTGLFDLVIRAMSVPVRWIGLPAEASGVFLLGFFRRDYGVAGLYDMDRAGGLTGNQLLVACVALTLFLPCIAQFLINVKERGWKVGISVSAFVLAFSFSAAFVLNGLLMVSGIDL